MWESIYTHEYGGGRGGGRRAAAGNKTYANGMMCDISATGILILSIAAHKSG